MNQLIFEPIVCPCEAEALGGLGGVAFMKQLIFELIVCF